MTYDFGEPQSRNEAILQNMLGAENEILPPMSRIEELLIDLWEELQEMGGSSVYIGATAPENPTEGMLWVDTSDDTTDIDNGEEIAFPEAASDE